MSDSTALEKKEAAPPQEQPVRTENIQAAMIEIVTRKDIEPERLEKFLNIQIMMEERQQAQAFQEAMAGFQGDCPNIKKTKKVDFESKNGNRTKYDYSPLEEIVRVAKPHLKKWGLSFSFNVQLTAEADTLELVTTISHAKGHAQNFSYFFKKLHDDQRMNLSQRAKSAITYAKRSALENALGIITEGEDDDAQSAKDREITADQKSLLLNLVDETKSNLPDLLIYLDKQGYASEGIDDMSFAGARYAILSLQEKKRRGI